MWNNTTPAQQTLLKTLQIPEPQTGVTIQLGGKGIRIERGQEGWRITVERDALIGRATMLIDAVGEQPESFSLEELPAYRDFGVMLDCSRNAVPRPETVKTLLRCLSRMGYTHLQLYLEDVYELEEYPYFGYGRGRYTKGELQDLDRYACSLGIELIPAIQTLAHLGQSLKWDAMQHLVDFDDILLIGSEATHRLLESMFRMLRGCFSTRRVNIGMDEAHMVGLGKYLDQHGYTDRTELLLHHFQKVRSIAVQYDFAPMLWSDMFFRLASGGDYYATESRLDPRIAEMLPDDTSLVYWDYYSEDKGIYNKMLAKHKQLTPNLLFAGGVWKWSGFSPCNAYSMKLADIAHACCTEQGVQQVFITMWADNGAECSPFAVLPALQYWAELCYQGDLSEPGMRRRFSAATQGDWDHFLLMDQTVFTPDNPSPGRQAVNASKTLLYEDILFPLFSEKIDLAAYSRHLASCSQQYQQLAGQPSPWQYLHDAHHRLCDALQVKSTVRAELRTAWKERDENRLQQLCDTGFPQLREALRSFVDAYHMQWLRENRAAGLDVFDLRLGGLLQRVDTAESRIRQYLAHQIDTVEELDMEWLPYSDGQDKKGFADTPSPFWHRIVSPSSVAQI